MLVMCVRTLVLYGVVFTATRLMGKREVGQLQPFEFVIALMIADVAATPMANNGIPIYYGILPIAALLVLHISVSWLMMKSRAFRDFMCGKPVVVVAGGKPDYTQLRRLRYSLSDIRELLRQKDIFTLEDVEYAIMETNGKLSVMVKPGAQPASSRDVAEVKNP